MSMVVDAQVCNLMASQSNNSPGGIMRPAVLFGWLAKFVDVTVRSIFFTQIYDHKITRGLCSAKYTNN